MDKEITAELKTKAAELEQRVKELGVLLKLHDKLIEKMSETSYED